MILYAVMRISQRQTLDSMDFYMFEEDNNISEGAMPSENDYQEPNSEQTAPLSLRGEIERSRKIVMDSQNERETQTQEAQNQTQFPTSWNSEGRSHFSALKPEVQKYILQREAEQQIGVEKLKQSYQDQISQLQSLRKAFNPYQDYIKSSNATEEQVISHFLDLGYRLQNGSPEEKAQIFLENAQHYGIDLTALVGQQSQQPTDYSSRMLSDLQREITSLKQERALESRQKYQSEIESFSKDKAYFEDLRKDMANLLNSGMAKDLNEAYEKASRLNGDVFQKIQAEQKLKAEKQKISEAKVKAEKAKKASVSVFGRPGITSSTKPNGSLRSMIEEAAREHGYYD